MANPEFTPEQLTAALSDVTALYMGDQMEKALDGFQGEAIRDHAIAVALDMRNTGRQENDLLERLSQDPRLSLPKEKLVAAISNPIEFVGNAPRQITTFASQVEEIVARYPEAANYEPEEIL